MTNVDVNVLALVDAIVVRNSSSASVEGATGTPIRATPVYKAG